MYFDFLPKSYSFLVTDTFYGLLFVSIAESTKHSALPLAKVMYFGKSSPETANTNGIRVRLPFRRNAISYVFEE